METNPRRELAILTFVTLDGVMQAPAQPDEDLSGGFEHGGWAMPYWEEVMQQVGAQAMAESYDLLLGRKTYESFASHFTAAGDDGEADMMNEATKYVATSTLKTLDWKNSIPIAGNIAEEVARLKTQEGPLLQVHGSWRLIQTLLASDLVDEFRLWTFPVVVGAGKRLFGDNAARREMTLVRSDATSNGVAMGIYRRGGRPKTR